MTGGGQVRAGFLLDKTFHCVLCGGQPDRIGHPGRQQPLLSPQQRATGHIFCFGVSPSEVLPPAVPVIGFFCSAMIYRFGVAAWAEML